MQRRNNWGCVRRLSSSLWLGAIMFHIRQVPVWAWSSQWRLPIQSCPRCSIVSLCFGRTVVESEQQLSNKQSNSAFIRKPTWDSGRLAPLQFSPRGLCRRPPGRCAPSVWANRPTGSAVRISTTTPAIPRELGVTRPLTLRVCSGGLIGGKWGAAEDSQGLCCACEKMDGCDINHSLKEDGQYHGVSLVPWCKVLNGVLGFRNNLNNTGDFNHHAK